LDHIQVCDFKGHDEHNKKNHSNFLEMVEILVSYNKQVRVFILGDVLQNIKIHITSNLKDNLTCLC
jgi:hypothetical protein